VEQILDVFETHLQIAETDIIKSSLEYPLNNICHTIDHLLSDFNFESNEWENILKRITDQMKRAAIVSAKVCSDASPEGNLPVTSDLTTDQVSNLSQILLRHCFRTLENSTSIFTKILDIYISKNHPLAFEYLSDIGDFLKLFMVTIRHRGAYLSIQENFLKVCQVAMNSGVLGYESLCSTWLNDYVETVTSLKVSVTRRSGGLPAGILSVVISPNDDSKRALFLDYVMKNLLGVMNSDVVNRDEQLDLPQVNAMNVARFIQLI
jgi:hypothetical protein